MADELAAAVAGPIVTLDVDHLPAPRPSLIRTLPHRLRNGVSRRLADRMLASAG
jgi:hypothetical protein